MYVCPAFDFRLKGFYNCNLSWQKLEGMSFWEDEYLKVWSCIRAYTWWHECQCRVNQLSSHMMYLQHADLILHLNA